MLKIKDNVDLKELEKYGFKKEPEKAYYYNYINEELEIFVWITKGYDYKPRHIYVESKDYTVIFSQLNALYDLIKADLVEKVD